MRLIGRLLIAVLLLLALGLGALAAWPYLAPLLSGNDVAGTGDARPLTAYLPPDNRELAFVLSRHPTRLRIAAFGLVPATDALPDDARWRYAYRVLDDAGAVLDQGELAGGCPPPGRLPLADGGDRPVRWSMEPGLSPCADELTFLQLPGDRPPARLQLRLIEMSPAFRGVAVRVAGRVLRGGANEAVVWHRLSDAHRAELARYSAYPADLLAPSEITALTREIWDPVGPQGIDGQDYDQLKIAALALDEIPRAPGTDDVRRIADLSHRVTLPVFQAGKVTLRLTPVPSPGATLPRGIEARIAWYAAQGAGASDRPLNVPAEGLLLSQEAGRGLLEIRSPLPLAVDVVEADARTLEHAEHRLRVLHLESGDSVDWAVSHAPGLTTAFRLDVRGHVGPAGGSAGTRDALAWEWLDAAGRALAQGTLSPAPVPSLYDRDERGGSITDPQSAWFRLPPAVRTVRVRARGVLLVNAHTRLDEDALARRIPDDQRGWFDDPGRAPEWFAIAPVSRSTTVAGTPTQLLYVQHRPVPETQVDEGTFVDSLAPLEAQALSVRFAVPDAAFAHRVEPAAASRFAPVPADCAVQLEPSRGEARIRPRLLFTGGSRPGPVEVVMDGVTLDIPAPAGSAGTLDLPTLAPGAHRICILDEARRNWFLSHAPAPRTTLLEAGGYRLARGQSLTFRVRKDRQPQALGLRWLGGEGAALAPVLATTIEGVPARGSFAGYTLRQRRWTLPLADGSRLPTQLLQQGGARASAPQMMSLTLDDDLPPGDYQVRITLVTGNPGFLALSRRDNAASGATRIYREDP